MRLLASELVTNAVRHGTPADHHAVGCDHSAGLTVRGSDANPTPPTARTAGHGQDSGRGVALVDVPSDDWEVEPAEPEPGKAVWCR